MDLNKQYNIDDKVTVSKSLRLKSGTGINEKSFFFIHGYELEFIRWEIQASLENYENICNEMCFNGNLIGKAESEIWDIS